MIDVFISYKVEDKRYAQSIAEFIVAEGFTVWWDVELLPGDTFVDEINAVLSKAKVIIVLWTPESVRSKWVLSEVTIAFEKEALIPVLLKRTTVPAPFNIFQTLDLTTWSGEPEAPILKTLSLAIKKKIGNKVDVPELSIEEIRGVLARPRYEMEFWSSITANSAEDDYAHYLNEYGDSGTFSELAKARIEVLRTKGPRIKPGATTSLKEKIVLAGAAMVVVGAIFIVIKGTGSNYEEHVPNEVVRQNNSSPENMVGITSPDVKIDQTIEELNYLEIPVTPKIYPNVDAVSELNLELVGNSFESKVQNQRQIYRFAIRVFNQDCVSVRGLQESLNSSLNIYEDSRLDIESPTTIDSRRNNIRIYFVLDASSSVTVDDRQQLVNAVSFVADRIPDDYLIDVRQFNGDVKKLRTYSEFQPDDGESASAFYFALDTVLDDIAAHSRTSRTDDYYAIVAFTDGVDYASRNHYPEADSHKAVRSKIRRKAQQLYNTLANRSSSGLELNILSVGDFGEQEFELDSLARSGGGWHKNEKDKSLIERSLNLLIERILSIYHIEYSSQQQRTDSHLVLKSTINSITKSIVIRDSTGSVVEDLNHCSQSKM